MKLSIVIPCYNAERTLSQQLEAFSKESANGDWELLLSDNGSTDDSRAIAEKYISRMPHLRIVDASARRSCASAKNIGAEAARGDALLFCDADDVIAPGYIVAMQNALAEHEFVACRYDFERLNPPWLVKARGQSQTERLNRLLYPPYLHHVWGGSMGIRRQLHERLGGFDESMRYLADTDYCVRAQLMGASIHFVREAVVHYRHRETLGGIYRQARNWAECDQAVFARYGGPETRARWRWRAHFNIWYTLMKRTPELLATPEGRGLAMYRLGSQVGYLVGSLKHRVAPIVEF
jgi:glycosyltransferase involved in cell wall biosynthesis